MGKGKQILVKKLLQLSHAVQSGWKKLYSGVRNLFSQKEDSDNGNAADSPHHFQGQDLPKKIWETSKIGAERFMSYVDAIIDWVESFFEKDDADEEDFSGFGAAME